MPRGRDIYHNWEGLSVKLGSNVMADAVEGSAVIAYLLANIGNFVSCANAGCMLAIRKAAGYATVRIQVETLGSLSSGMLCWKPVGHVGRVLLGSDRLL